MVFARKTIGEMLLTYGNGDTTVHHEDAFSSSRSLGGSSRSSFSGKSISNSQRSIGNLSVVPENYTSKPSSYGIMRRDEGSRRGDAIRAHSRRYCYWGGFMTRATLLTCIIRMLNIGMALYVALTEQLLIVRVFVISLVVYQIVCLGLQLTAEERVNPYASLYEYTKATYEYVKIVLAVINAIIMAFSLPYLAMYTDEPKWRHAGWGVLLFVLPAVLDYRVRRSLGLLFCLKPENKEDDDDGQDIDFGIMSVWIKKYLIFPVELGPAAVFALAEQMGPKWFLGIALFFNISNLIMGILTKMSPGSCWIDRDGKLYIPINATEADLSYAGFLLATDCILDDEVSYFAAGNVSAHIPKILHWISYAGLPQPGKWGSVLGDGCVETGAELCVEKLFGHSLMHQYMGQAYIQLGNQVFEIQGGCIEASANPMLLNNATPISGTWEVI